MRFHGKTVLTVMDNEIIYAAERQTAAL